MSFLISQEEAEQRDIGCYRGIAVAVPYLAVFWFTVYLIYKLV